MRPNLTYVFLPYRIAEAGCFHGWVTGFEYNCYYFVNDEVSHNRATQLCRDRGAHPLFLETTAETQWVIGYRMLQPHRH